MFAMLDGNREGSRRWPPCFKREFLLVTKKKFYQRPTTDNGTTKSLVLLNYYYSNANFTKDLMNAMHTCYAAASNRWANFIAVNMDKVCMGHF